MKLDLTFFVEVCSDAPAETESSASQEGYNRITITSDELT